MTQTEHQPDSRYESIIGVEIHVQLNTASKMFSGDSNADSLEPNVHVNPVSLGHPGTLPVLNRQAVESAVLAGLAFKCDIASFTKFDRKHYFYPDLPKGYQISQYDLPICSNGSLEIYPDDMNPEIVELERIHLEEDAAKNIHVDGATLVDFNRAGSPLIEIVTRPCFRSAKSVRAFLGELQMLMRYLGVSEADMEKGHLRVDANISLRPAGDDALYPKTEVKNLNSFKGVERAIQYEIERQTELWDSNNAPDFTETRGWVDQDQITVSQRSKEEAADYRFFPEPDIPPIRLDDEFIQRVKRRLPELPMAKRNRFREEYFLSYYDAKVLTADPVVAEFYERTVSELQSWLYSLDDTEGSDTEIWDNQGKKLTRLVSNWITSEIFGLLSKQKQSFADLKITPENLAELITIIYQNKVNSSAAQTILKVMFDKGADPSQVMQEQDLEQIEDDDLITTICTEVINTNLDVVSAIKDGRDRQLMFLVGQVMKQTKGKANPQTVTEVLRSIIDQLVD